MPTPLSFTNLTYSHLAHGDTHTYVIRKGYAVTAKGRPARMWNLEIRKTITVAGVKVGDADQKLHSEYYELMRDAVQVARNFEILGDDYTDTRHDGKTRFDTAHAAMFEGVDLAAPPADPDMALLAMRTGMEVHEIIEPLMNHYTSPKGQHVQLTLTTLLDVAMEVQPIITVFLLDQITQGPRPTDAQIRTQTVRALNQALTRRSLPTLAAPPTPAR